MKNFSIAIIAELEEELKTIHNENNNPIQYAEKAIKTTITSVEKLKTSFKKHKFNSKIEEIEFFKVIKPQLTSKLIYYNEIYNIEISKPSGAHKVIQKHYNKELNKLKTFFNENLEFYKYYRTGNTYFDKKYFLRKKYDIRLTLDSVYFQSDYSFATSHDYKVAKIIANDSLQIFLENKLKTHKSNIEKVSRNKVYNSELKWTGSKVALVELMYALHTEKAINNGNLSLNETAKNIETIFNIDMGQFNRIYLEIKKRKTIEKTSFLNSLKENLIKRIDDADEK